MAVPTPAANMHVFTFLESTYIFIELNANGNFSHWVVRHLAIDGLSLLPESHLLLLLLVPRRKVVPLSGYSSRAEIGQVAIGATQFA